MKYSNKNLNRMVKVHAQTNNNGFPVRLLFCPINNIHFVQYVENSKKFEFLLTVMDEAGKRKDFTKCSDQEFQMIIDDLYTQANLFAKTELNIKLM